MTIQELIQKCGIKEHSGNQIMVDKTKVGSHLEEIKARKEEILSYFAAQHAAVETARKDREAKINAIEGLNELQEAIEAEVEHHAAFTRMMENEGQSGNGALLPSLPEVSSKDLKAQYPRAAAYLKAQNYSLASNYAKASAGKKALERIIKGEDYEKVLADMEAEWSAHCEGNMWN